MDPQPAVIPAAATGKPARPLRRLVAVAIVVVLLVAAWLAAGPWLAIRGIERAIERRDTAALERHVDFPRLRINLKAQLEDRMVRAAGGDIAASPLGAIALSMAGGATGVAVDAMATPMGVGALLQGHVLWQRASGDTRGDGLAAETEPARPLRNARHRYESLSRFSATVDHADGSRTVFVLERQGLRWRLVDVRLPEDLSAYLR
jgi:hypothetical protein